MNLSAIAAIARRSAFVGGSILVAASLGLGCKSKAADVTNTPPSVVPTLVNVLVAPTSIVGGTAVQGTVTLSAPPTSGVTVTLSSNNAAVTVPSSVVVNSGALSMGFAVTTRPTASSTTVTISGTYSGTTRSAELTVTP